MADQLPAGYKLDVAPTLPTGYKLDASQPAAAPKPGWETFKTNMGQTGSAGDYVGRAAHMLTAPVTGLLGVPGEVIDWAKRGFRNRNLEEGGMPAGNTGEDPVSQMIGAASMALLPPDLASARDAAGTATTAGKGFVKGGFEAGKTAVRSPMNYVGTSAAELLAGQLGIPHGVATAISEGAQIAHGGWKGAKAAVAERAAAANAHPPSAVSPTPPPAFQPKALLGPGPVITPPPADASFVRSVPAQYPQVETPAATPSAATTAIAATAEDTALLDGIAQSLNGTPFAKASPASQAMIRTLASRLDKPVPADLNTPPPPATAPRAPMAAPEPAAPGKTLQQLIQEDLAAKRATQPPERQPAPAATQGPAVPVNSEVKPAQSLAEQLRDEMASSGSYQEPVPEAPTPAYNPPGRATNAANLAKVFHQHGISVDDAMGIPLDDPTWKNLSDSLGQKRPSKETVEATLVELRRLEKAAKN